MRNATKEKVNRVAAGACHSWWPREPEGSTQDGQEVLMFHPPSGFKEADKGLRQEAEKVMFAVSQELLLQHDGSPVKP